MWNYRIILTWSMLLTRTIAAGNDLTFQQIHSSDSASVHISPSFCPTIHFWSDISVELIRLITGNFRRMIFDMFSSSLNLTIHNPKSNMDGEEWFHKVPFHHQYLKEVTWFPNYDNGSIFSIYVCSKSI